MQGGAVDVQPWVEFQFYISAITMVHLIDGHYVSEISILHKCDYNDEYIFLY